MASIEDVFNDHFAHWGIRLPHGTVERRERGRIVRAGWAIRYRCGCDEKGEYLDYYASHRMTSDRHVRMRGDGRCEELPAIRELCLRSEDPEEDARLEAEYFARNREVASMLEEKGFGLRGDEPGGVLINRYLHLNRMDE